MTKSRGKTAPPPVAKEDADLEKKEFPQRLCSEIQLFDLCEKADCVFKRGRYCTDPAMLAKFESINDDDDGSSSNQYLVDEIDEDTLEYDEGIGVDEEEPGDEDY